jgi:hypothetical protein
VQRSAKQNPLFDECLALHVSAVGILRVDNDALDSLDQLEGAVVAILDRLRRPAPAAIQNGVGGGDFGCGRGSRLIKTWL